MPSADEFRGLRGREVTLQMDDGSRVSGRVVGTLDAADGLVVVLERDEPPGARFSCNYQSVSSYTAR